MNHINPLQVVLERLGYADPAKGVFFFWDEVKDWPAGALDVLMTSGLLQQAQLRDAIECDGCEENCINKPVVVYLAQDDKPGRAFIVCDEPNDMGRIRVSFDRMRQWQTTGELIAAALTKLLGFSQPSTQAADGKQWNIGVLKGKINKSQVTLLAEDNFNLSLAGQTIPLIDVLTIQENALVLDEGELIRLVDKPAGDNEATDAEEVEVLNFGNDEAKMYAATNIMSSVPASEIRWKFTVIKSEDANEKWWKKMMRNASDTGLKECRVGGGRKGAVGSLWRPDLIAVWLVERTDKKLEGGMNKNAARAALKKFTGYEEAAEELFPSDE